VLQSFDCNPTSSVSKEIFDGPSEAFPWQAVRHSGEGEEKGSWKSFTKQEKRTIVEKLEQGG
jgi:hypothetical protein